jgi:uncharacterized protein with HEPN domain
VPSSDSRGRIDDILEAIATIDQFTDGMTLATFSADRRTIHAVLYNFIVIGEAARHVAPEIVARYPSIPWPKMRAMRNVMVHEYLHVVVKTVWDTLRDDLPPLVPVLREILEREP